MAGGPRRIEGSVLSENQEMVKMCGEFWFVVVPHKQDPCWFLAALDPKHSS